MPLPTAVQAYWAHPIPFGGVMTPRAEVARILREEGASEGMVSRYLQGADMAERVRARSDRAGR